jgi:adenosylcobinamide hydrolase
MELDFPGISLQRDHQALVLHSQAPLTTLSSAVAGGGLAQVDWILVQHVPKGYASANPTTDLDEFAASRGIQPPYIGLLTAASLEKAQAASFSHGDLRVAALVTAGVSNAASAGISPPVEAVNPQASGGNLSGTINIILLVEAILTPAAMVNAVITATEAKSDVLRQRGIHTSQGELATGTSSDAIVVAATGGCERLEYAGPATRVGWLIARGVRQALGAALV